MSAAKLAGAEVVSFDSAARVRRAANGSTEPSELQELATDPDVLVRAAVAINRSCGPDVDTVLTSDTDERVRALLAGRIARLLPELALADYACVAPHVRQILSILVEDEAVRVRTVIADAIKDMPEAPREIVLRLAWDATIEVSDPIVRLSPVLTDADLLALLATPPHPSTGMSVAVRPGLSATVTDAIVAHTDAPVVRAMLANESAHVREATLDVLVGQAAANQDWHGPLVRRPALTARAARALSSLVTTQLLEVLSQRTDLDPVVLQSIRDRLAVRVNHNALPDRENRALITDFLRMRKAKLLNEAVLLQAAAKGEARTVAAILAVACDVPLSTIDRVVGLRSAKGLVSLAWRAGFTMRSGITVQTVLGQISPATLLMPTGSGGFPLSEDEMRWQLELFSEHNHQLNPTEARRSLALLPEASPPV